MIVIQKMALTKKAFSVVALLVRIHLTSLQDLYELLRSTKQEFVRKTEFTASSLQAKVEF